MSVNEHGLIAAAVSCWAFFFGPVLVKDFIFMLPLMLHTRFRLLPDTQLLNFSHHFPLKVISFSIHLVSPLLPPFIGPFGFHACSQSPGKAGLQKFLLFFLLCDLVHLVFVIQLCIQLLFNLLL